MYLIARRNACPTFFSARGFSLLEFAIVLAVFAMVLGTFLVPLTKQIEQQRYSETQHILASARDALVSFAAANGRLPCPAVNPGIAGNPPAAEAFATPADNSSTGSCMSFYSGYLPATTLGFTPVDDEGYAVDAWGLKQNRIRYAITPIGIPVANTFMFTKTPGIKNALAPADVLQKISSATSFLSVCADTPTAPPPVPCGGATTVLANGNAIAVIFSLGPDAIDNNPSAAELINLDGDAVFVSHSLRTTGQVFDDVVTWIGPNLLIGRMIASGYLP